MASVTAGWSSPSETAKTAFEQKDYATALRIWRPLADGGDVDAQLGVAVIYADGLGVSRDYVLAARWFRAAALKGSARAQFNLATMHFLHGQGVPQSYAEAVRWFRRAADQGHAGAQYNLGNLYAEGRGIARDSGAAMQLYRLAAGQEYSAAQAALAIGYIKGEGVAQDDTQRLHDGPSVPPNEDTSLRNTIWKSCLQVAVALRKIGCKPSSGIVRLPNKATRSPNQVSRRCMLKGMERRAMSFRRLCGLISPQAEVMQELPRHGLI